MATPSKQRKREEAETASVSGFIMNVSPMKTSKKGFPYFNACIQEKDKTSGIVAFNENKRKELKLLEEQRTPVKLSPIQHVPSYKSPGDFDIKLTNSTKITPAKVDYTFEDNTIPHQQKITEVKIQDVNKLPQDTKVTVTAKVTKQLESVQQDLQYNRTMKRTTFIIADETGAIQLTLWGSDDQLVKDSSYKFENLSIKTFESTKLSTNPYSIISKVDDIQNVADDDTLEDINVKELQGNIAAVAIELQYKCFFCKTIVTVNEDIQSLKCQACQKRQLVTTVTKHVKAEITLSVDNSHETFILPKEILETYTLGIEKLEDKELFILNHSNVKIKVFNKVVQELEEIL